MEAHRVYRLVLIVLLVGTGVAVGGSLTSPARTATPAPAEADVRTTVDGVRYTVHPSELVTGCLGGRDCIRSIDDPRFEPAGNVTALADDELVIALTVDGESKAYPLRLIWTHEIVNDELTGRPIAVTYCPLCRSGLVFSREVGHRTLEFGVSGKLLNANLVMYDRQTGTYWSQVRASAIVGPLVPADLTVLPSRITTWGQWRRAHPDTRVLVNGLRRPGTAPVRAGAYAGGERVGYGVGSVDARVGAKRIVYGVRVGGEAKAYLAADVEAAGAINDEVGGVRVLVVADRHEGGVTVFLRTASSGTHTFAVVGGDLVDERGHEWRFDGTAVEGPHEGDRLERRPSHGYYWFAWVEFNPDTAVYRPNETG